MATGEAIILEDVTKTVGKGPLRRSVLDGMCGTFKFREHYAILGHPGSGRTSLARIIAGLDVPSTGRIKRFGAVSIPVGVGGIVTGKGLLRELITIYARLFDSEPRQLLDFVAEFAELGGLSKAPIDILSPEVRTKISYALAYGLPCDVYVLDGVTGWGQKSFREKCMAAYQARSEIAGTVYITKSPKDARRYGKRGGVIHAGKLFFTDSVDEALDLFARFSSERNPEHLAYLVDQMIRNHDLVNAHKYLGEYLSVQPGDPRALSLYAKLSYQSGDLDRAEVASRKALAVNKNDVEAQLLLAKMAERAGKWEEAGILASDILNVRPSDSEGLAILARASEAMGANARAAEAWRLLANGDELSAAYANAIRCDIRTGNFSRALQDIGAATAKEGNRANTSLLSLKISTLLDMEDFDGFIVSVGQVSKIDMEKALSLTSAARSRLNYKHIIGALEEIFASGLQPNGQSRSLKILVSHLRREASIASKKGDERVGAEIQLFLERNAFLQSY